VSSMSVLSPRRQAIPDPGCGLVIGIDISQGRFDWRPCRLGSWGKHQQHPRSQAGFLAFEEQLQGFVDQGQEVWLGQEPTGPYGQCLQEWLLDRGWKLVLVNPYHVHRIQETRDNSPRKDDQKDPGVIADLIWQGSYYQPRRLRGPYAELRAGIVEWYSLAKKRTALRNEAQALLEGWFPELTELFKDRLCLSVRSVIRRYESPAALAQAGKGSLRATLKQGTHGKKTCYTESIWEAARSSVALREGQQSRVRALRGALEQLALVERRQQALKEELAQWLAQTQEAAFLMSVPQVSVITAAGLLGECGPLAEFPNVRTLQKFVGLHLCRSASGRRRGKLHISKRGRSGARYLLGRLAAVHTQADGLGHAWAQARKAQGVPALVVQTALARKLLGLLYALARDQHEFDPNHWELRTQTADGVSYLQGAPMAA
jgi:transposase